jgi:hypothetical protein
MTTPSSEAAAAAATVLSKLPKTPTRAEVIAWIVNDPKHLECLHDSILAGILVSTKQPQLHRV